MYTNGKTYNMREIELRAFVKGRGIYTINGFRKCKVGMTIFPVDSIGLDMDDWYFPEELPVILRPVGLVDSDNQDIYEGDILQSQVDDVLFNWLVVHNGFSFAIKNIGLYDLALVPPFIVNCAMFFIDRKVIGNMYQNPELIKIED